MEGIGNCPMYIFLFMFGLLLAGGALIGGYVYLGHQHDR